MKKSWLVKIVLPLFIASALGLKATASFFSDTESLTNNVLSAATDFGSSAPSATPTYSSFPTSTPLSSSTPTPTGTPLINLVINEVYYDVDSREHGNKTEDDPVDQWIEIYNPTNVNIPFKDWQICNNASCVTVHPNVSIPALGFALVSRDANTWNFWSVPSGVEKINSLGGTPLALANGGDMVILIKSGGEEIDRMSWGSEISGFTSGCGSTCPSVAEGHSLERSPDGKDTDSASDFVDNSLPTPGL